MRFIFPQSLNAILDFMRILFSRPFSSRGADSQDGWPPVGPFALLGQMDGGDKSPTSSSSVPRNSPVTSIGCGMRMTSSACGARREASLLLLLLFFTPLPLLPPPFSLSSVASGFQGRRQRPFSLRSFNKMKCMVAATIVSAIWSLVQTPAIFFAFSYFSNFYIRKA